MNRPMSFLSDFEGRISSVFGAAPQGYTEPFSFKKLAKRAAREMENETYEIDGVDTAPGLYTVLVSATDDSLMRPLYEQITFETASFVTAQAQKKGYTFVGSPLVRFMVDDAPGFQGSGYDFVVWRGKRFVVKDATDYAHFGQGFIRMVCWPEEVSNGGY